MTGRRLVRAGQLLVGFAVSGLCLVLAFGSVPFGDLAGALSRANYWWLGPAAGAQVASMLARTRRWQVLLLGRARFGELFWAQAIGFLGNNIFPLRAGEAARVLVVSRRTGLPLAQVGASVVLERALDVATVLVLLGILLPVVRVPPAALAAGEMLGLALAVVVLVLCALLRLGGRADEVVASLARRLPDDAQRMLVARWRDLMSGLEAMRGPGAGGRALGWSLVTWAASVATYWAVIEAVAPGASPVEPAFAVAIISVGISLPSSPGFVGIFQFIGQQALVAPFPERYSLGSALSIALLAHAVYYVLTSGAGLLALVRLGLSLSDVHSARQQPAGTLQPSEAYPA